MNLDHLYLTKFFNTMIFYCKTAILKTIIDFLLLQIKATVQQYVSSSLSKGNQCFSTSRFCFNYYCFSLTIDWVIKFSEITFVFSGFQCFWYIPNSEFKLCWWCINDFKTTGLSYTAEFYCELLNLKLLVVKGFFSIITFHYFLEHLSLFQLHKPFIFSLFACFLNAKP